MTLHTDVLYSPGNERGYLDITVPDGDGPFPFVVGIHGGAWQGGEKEGMYPYAEILAEMGIAAVLPNYRLTGTDPHPAQQDDVLCALDWAAEHAAEYSLDPARVGVTGVSAGGHLTALVGLKATQATDAPYTIRCMLPVCGPTDMAHFLADSPAIRPVLEALVGGPMEENAQATADVSPITHVHPGAPPCLATHGDIDSVVPHNQSAFLVDALRAVGVEAQLILVPGVDHAAYMPDTDPPEPLGGAEAFRGFFRRHLLEV